MAEDLVRETSQPVSTALMQFRQAAGIQSFFGSAVARDAMSPEASGSLTMTAQF